MHHDLPDFSEEPTHELDLRDYVWLCEVDLCKAWHYFDFKSDIAEPGDPPAPTCADATEVEGFHYVVEYLMVKLGIGTHAFAEAIQEEVRRSNTCPCWPASHMKLKSEMTDDGVKFVLINEPH
jgi:hypothetical protein